MAVRLMSTMAHTNSSSSNSASAAKTSRKEGKLAVFHDFLGRGSASDLSPAGAKATTVDVMQQWEASPSASASAGVSSGGARGLVSTSSDLGTERQVGNHLEGVPFYGPRTDFSVSDTSNRFPGSKRMNPDAGFVGSGDGFSNMIPDSVESSHLTKMLRNAGGERPRWSRDEETLLNAHAIRPTSVSFISQAVSGGKADANVLKWDRTIPMGVGPMSQHPLRLSQVTPFGYQSVTNRFKDNNVCPSVISQAAADEGSRTEIKGSGILSSINANGCVSENLSIGGKKMSGIHISELETSIAPSGNRHGLTSTSRQMTIFYGGQAHVFDDVHPNKADVIMTLAGSNGGSWSTTYSPKSAGRPSSGENCMLTGNNDIGTANNVIPRESRGRLPFMGHSGQGFGSSDRSSMRPGIHQNSFIMKNEKATVGAAEHDTKGKHEEADHSNR